MKNLTTRVYRNPGYTKVLRPPKRNLHVKSGVKSGAGRGGARGSGG